MKTKIPFSVKCLFICLFHFAIPVDFTAAQELNSAEKRKIALGSEAMATTAHPLATQAAIEILQKGGNAVDATVAAAFAIGVVEPDASGLGGGGGMVIYRKEDPHAVYINYYPQTSSRVGELKYTSSDARSAKAVLVPGTVAGLTEALDRFGTLPLSVVLEPSIRFAEVGFPIDETLAGLILDHMKLLQKYPSTEALYIREGFPMMFRDTLRQTELGRTLRIIAEEGRAGFYEGRVAQTIVDEVTRHGGVLTMEDLKNYRPIVGEPVRGSYRGFEVLSAGVPQSGVSVIQALNILEFEDLKSLGHFSKSAETLHLMAETMRRVYADRMAVLEDPRFNAIPVNGMISKRFAKVRYEDINRVEAIPREYRKTQAGDPGAFDPGFPGRIKKPDSVKTEEEFGMWLPFVPEEDASEVLADAAEGWGHTTHLSVVDKEGNAVSLSQTLGTFFGSGLTAAGALLNTTMSNFSTRSSVNSVAPNKQPRSSIAPTILLKDGRPFMTIGSPGAGRIIATVVQLIVNAVDFGMDAGEVNRAPRFFCQKLDDYLSLEDRISAEVREALVRKGHTLKLYGDFDLFFGGAQLIMVNPETGQYAGSADPRRGGVSIGY